MALYNNGYPMTYQPMYQQYQQPMMPQPAQIPQATQAQSNGIIWVSGEAGAKAYLVAPNTTVQLWDSEAQRIYLKSADASGMPSIKTLDYTIREAPQQNAPAVTQEQSRADYATKEDVSALYEQISTLRAEIDGLTIRKAPAKRKVDDDDE